MVPTCLWLRPTYWSRYLVTYPVFSEGDPSVYLADRLPSVRTGMAVKLLPGYEKISHLSKPMLYFGIGPYVTLWHKFRKVWKER